MSRSPWVLPVVIGSIFVFGLLIGVVIIVFNRRGALPTATTTTIPLGQTNTSSTNQQTDIEINYCVTCPDNKVWTNTATINRVYTDGFSEVQTVTKTSTGYNLRIVRTDNSPETIIDAPEINGPPITTSSNSIITTTTDTLNHLVIDVSTNSQKNTYIVPLVR